MEDEDEHGNVWKVTDGQLSFIHRKLHDLPIYYKDCVPSRSFRQVDSSPMDTSKVELLSFDMLPTSHLFLAGHRMQIRLAGVDVDNFKMVYTEKGEWQVQHNSTFSSHIELPIIEPVSEVGIR